MQQKETDCKASDSGAANCGGRGGRTDHRSIARGGAAAGVDGCHVGCKCGCRSGRGRGAVARGISGGNRIIEKSTKETRNRAGNGNDVLSGAINSKSCFDDSIGETDYDRDDDSDSLNSEEEREFWRALTAVNSSYRLRYFGYPEYSPSKTDQNGSMVDGITPQSSVDEWYEIFSL
jgi:hypothetical protein